MKRTRIVALVGVAFMLAGAPAFAQDKTVIDTTLSPQSPVNLHNNGDGSYSRSVYAASYRYQLLGTYAGTGSSSSGAAVGPVLPGAYTFACSGTIGGGVITLQVLGPDGVTFQTVSGINFGSLPATASVVMPAIAGASGSPSVTAANAKAVLTGASGASVFCSLS